MAEEVALMMNGINCNGCKKSLTEGLAGFEVVSIETKAETGVHPNKVVVKGDAEAIKAAIEKLDHGRGKFTIADA
ncbi:hypothetical protein AB1Y20_002898 [Prymnesium parvum]|uniref:HMA domain-containing protein n=1 Tax=Prymnesium parvum TaxID=97485 RepID=A0AB34J9A8_PRYPA